MHDDVTAYRLSWWRSRLIGYAVHVYVVRGTMVDSGYPAAQRHVAQILREESVRGVYITHQHEDHAGNVPWLAQRGVPLAMGAPTEKALRQSGRIGLYRHITWSAMPAFTQTFQPFVADGLQLVFAPGHSPDHHVVWDAQTATVFAGDLFLGVKVKTAHRTDDPVAHVRALRDIVSRQPARVFCAHRGLLPHGASMLAAKADWIEALMERVAHLARTGLDPAAIRARLLGAHSLTHWASAGDYSGQHLIDAMIRATRADRDANGASPSSPPVPRVRQ